MENSQMNAKRVNVLISTYNGQLYIRDQIESIKKQSYPNIKIYVRDDGSSDDTRKILKELAMKGEIIYIEGENIKWGRSFMELLKYSDEGDYWAFCDQDDIWLPDKIKWAVEWLDRQSNKEPRLFHSAYVLMNEDLSKEIGVYNRPKYEFTFRRALTDCLYQGFSMVINGNMRSLMLNANINNISSHDWWACLLVTEFGKSKFDDRIASKHRRLKESLSGGGLKGKLKWFKSTLKNKNSDINCVSKEFVRVFSQQAVQKDLNLANLFVLDKKYSLKKSLKKAFYPGRWRANISSEISIRILMLLGKI